MQLFPSAIPILTPRPQTPSLSFKSQIPNPKSRFEHAPYNIRRMLDVAIIGGGELGGLVAHVLARRDTASDIRIIDDAGGVAAGKALDITQAAPVERFSTRVSGSADLAVAAGCGVVVLADRVGSG